MFVLPSKLERYRSFSRPFLLNALKYGHLSFEDLDLLFLDKAYRFNYLVNHYYLESGEKIFYALLSSFRGNQVYCNRVDRRFRSLFAVGRDLIHFSSKDRGLISGSCLFLTLKYDRNRFTALDGYGRCSLDTNLYLANLRRKFGKISVVRVNEGDKNHLPHVHLLIIFHDYSFQGKRLANPHGKVKNRVIGKDFRFLKGKWLNGFSDVVLVNSYRGGLQYLAKYLFKGLAVRNAKPQQIRAMALSWLHGKRTFSISGKLFDSEVIRSKHNSNIEYDLEGFFIDRFGKRRTKSYFSGFLNRRSRIPCHFDGGTVDKKRLVVIDSRVRRVNKVHCVYPEFGDYDITSDRKTVFYYEYVDAKFPETFSEKLTSY